MHRAERERDPGPEINKGCGRAERRALVQRRDRAFGVGNRVEREEEAQGMEGGCRVR